MEWAFKRHGVENNGGTEGCLYLEMNGARYRQNRSKRKIAYELT